MILHAACEPGVLEIVKHPARLWGTAYDDSCKVQFDLRGRTLAAHGDFWFVGSYLPSALYRLPRRKEVRTRHATHTGPRVKPGPSPADMRCRCRYRSGLRRPTTPPTCKQLMHFVDTRPFTRDERSDPVLLAAMERHRVAEPERMRQVLARLQHLEAPVVIGLPETGAFFSATLWSVDAGADRLVFHAAREPKAAVIVTDPGRLWGAAYDGNCKVQFDLRGRTLAQQHDTWVVGSHMPSALFVLPRRTDVRARHADGQEPVVRFGHPLHAGQTLALRVHDISRGGLAIVAHPGEAPLSPGLWVAGAQIELAPGGIVTADFQVQNVLPHDEEEPTVRFGCAWTQMSAQAVQRVHDWTQRARRRKQLLSLSLDL